MTDGCVAVEIMKIMNWSVRNRMKVKNGEWQKASDTNRSTDAVMIPQSPLSDLLFITPT